MQESFTRPLVWSERFSTGATLQYYEVLPSIKHLAIYVREKICSRLDRSCQTDAVRIASADYVDVDYDTISQTFTFSIFYPNAPVATAGKPTDGWDEVIDNYAGSIATEIGILSNEQPMQPEELSLRGVLITLGKGLKPSKYSG